MKFHLSLAEKIQLRRILALAIPNGLQSALDMLTLAFALIFLSSISTLHFTALGIGMNYIIMFYPIAAIFGVGTSVLIARRFGAKNYLELNQIYMTMVISACVFSLPTLLVVYYGIPVYLKSLQLSDELYKLTYDYVSLTIFAIPAIIIKNVLISAFAAIGDTKRPFYIKIFLTFFSILGYYMLIDDGFGVLSLGLIGAAYVTLLSVYLEIFALFILPCFIKTVLRIKLHFNRIFLYNAIKIGVPTGLERIFTVLSITIILIFVGQYADIYQDSAMTGFQAGAKIEAFSFVPGFGFMVAIMSLVGQSIGANKYHRAEQYTRLCAIISSLFLGLCGVILAFFAESFSSFFIQDDVVGIQIAVAYLIAVGLSQIPLILSFVYDGALRGAGFTQIPLFINIISISVFRLFPMWICVHFKWNIYMLFFLIFLETYIRAVIFYFVFKSGVWKKTKNI